MLMKKFTFAVSLLLLAIVQSHADSISGTGSFAVITPESDINTARPRTIYKPTVTRTELKVSRSLNPDSMQTLNVRTNDGGIATILVKKRDGKTSTNNEPLRPPVYDVSNAYSRGEIKRGLFGPVQVLSENSEMKKMHQQQQQFENGRIYNKLALQPVTTLQQQQNIRSPYRFATANDEKSINLINSFMKHVQQVESTRAARSPSDSIPNDRASVHTKIPEPVTINSESIYVKDNQHSKRGRSLMEIDSDGIPLINGIRVPDDENDKRQTWRNARVINGILTPYENGYVPPRTVEYGQLIYPLKKEDSQTKHGRKKSIGPFTTADNFSGESQEHLEDSAKGIGPFSVTDMFTSRSSTRNSGIGPFSIADNSRSSNVKLIDYIKRINDQENRKDYFAGRVPKDVSGTQQIQRRMLVNPGNTYFPPSSLYSVDKSKQSEPVSTAPILQYAHPEFGLQSVGSSEEPKNNYKKPEYYTHSSSYQHPSQKSSSPNTPFYQIEPAALNTREYYNYQQSKMPQHPHQMYPSQYNGNYGYIRRVKPEQPFWMKLSEQFRDTFQSGFAQVHEIAKPVVDPILEAGEKISYNLGFSHQTPQQMHAQEKVGVVPHHGNSKSYIIPALGMLAGGAALGLGAVAMGRIFDVSTLLQMRSSSEQDHLDLDQQRALKAIRQFPTTTLYLVEDNKKTNEGKSSEAVPSTYATSKAHPKSNFYEVIAIPYENSKSIQNDSSIDPISRATSAELISHQRRKRNK